jgi:hypothetical protein
LRRGYRGTRRRCGCGWRGRRRGSIDCLDRFRALAAQIKESLLFLAALAGPFLALLLDLRLQAVGLPPAVFDERGPFLLEPLNLVVDGGALLSQPIVLELLSLTLVEDAEKDDRWHPGGADLAIFPDEDVVLMAHVDNDARRLANLQVFEHRPVDADAGSA